MYDRILIPTDGSRGTAHVAMHALDIAEQNDAEVCVLYVVDDEIPRVLQDVVGVRDELEEVGRQSTTTIARMAEARDLEVTTEVREADPADEIVDYAESGEFDLVVMGTHGHGGLGKRLIGSVTEHVVRESTVPVLSMRLGESDVTVESAAEAVCLAREALAHAGHPDADVDADPERQVSVWVATASDEGSDFTVYVDPVTQRTDVIRR